MTSDSLRFDCYRFIGCSSLKNTLLLIVTIPLEVPGLDTIGTEVKKFVLVAVMGALGCPGCCCFKFLCEEGADYFLYYR